MRLTEASGVSKLRGKGCGRAKTRNKVQSPCKPTCLGLWCLLKATRVSELPMVPIYDNALEIIPVTHYCGFLLSAFSCSFVDL